MSRPRQYDQRVQTQVRMPVDLHAQLAAAAEERMLSVNYLITRAIEEYLTRLVPVDELTRVE